MAEDEGLEVGKLGVSQLKVWKNVVTNLTSNKTLKPKWVNPKKVNKVAEKNTNEAPMVKSSINYDATSFEVSFNQVLEVVNDGEVLKVNNLDMTLKALDGHEANKALQALEGSDEDYTAKKLMKANSKRR